MSRTGSLPQIVSVVVMLVTWFVASNRCAVATMARETVDAKVAEIHKCCPDETSRGGEEEPAQRNGECCQRLNVPPAEAAGKLATAPAEVDLGALAWAGLDMLQREASEGKIARAQGPPGVRSFAEVVLQRSLLSHAPPVVS